MSLFSRVKEKANAYFGNRGFSKQGQDSSALATVQPISGHVASVSVGDSSMSGLPKDQDKENYKELYSLGKELLKDHQDRSSKLDQKASQLLPAVAMVVGVTSLVTKWTVERGFPPQNAKQYIFCVLLAVVILAIVNTLFCVFKTLEIKDSKTINFGDSVIDVFDRFYITQAYLEISLDLKDCIDKRLEVNRGKTKWLRRSQRSIIFANIVLIITLVVGFIIRAL